VGATAPLTGRYAVQGAQVRAGLVLWAHSAGARLEVLDDGSDPPRAAALALELHGRCDVVLGPYGSDCVRAVASAGLPGTVWNHGGAADDVQRLPGVVSVPSPASRYLVALGQAVTSERPGARVVLALGSGPFARQAREGLEREQAGLGLEIAGVFPLTAAPAELAAARPDAVLLCGPIGPEIRLLRALRPLLPDALLGGVSPGVHAFPDLLGGDPEGLLAVCQWHPSRPARPQLGPGTAEVIAAARRLGLADPDYVAAQAYACALVAARCREAYPDDPLAAARSLTTATFFGAFALDATGLQVGHTLCVVRWRRRRQELLLAEA
jgi:ABC-type branched-subunit amino acid transport system substrate-binding protein